MLQEFDPGGSAEESEILVPLQVGGDRVYLAARHLGAAGDEREIASRRPTLDDVVNGLTALARGAAAGLRDTNASKIMVEFGCEFAIESGTLVAIVGKATGKSAFKVGLEWSAPADPR